MSHVVSSVSILLPCFPSGTLGDEGVGAFFNMPELGLVDSKILCDKKREEMEGNIFPGSEETQIVSFYVLEPTERMGLINRVRKSVSR